MSRRHLCRQVELQVESESEEESPVGEEVVKVLSGSQQRFYGSERGFGGAAPVRKKPLVPWCRGT